MMEIAMATASLEGFATGYVEPNYPSAERSIQVVNSFYFRFDQPDTDHHLQHIMLLPGGFSADLTPAVDLEPSTIPAGRAELVFQDDDPDDDDDEYFYRAAHAMLDGRARRFQFRDFDRGSVRRPLPPGILRPADSVT